MGPAPSGMPGGVSGTVSCPSSCGWPAASLASNVRNGSCMPSTAQVPVACSSRTASQACGRNDAPPLSLRAAVSPSYATRADRTLQSSVSSLGSKAEFWVAQQSRCDGQADVVIRRPHRHAFRRMINVPLNN